jgi:superfamily I DNA and RNA helicase
MLDATAKLLEATKQLEDMIEAEYGSEIPEDQLEAVRAFRSVELEQLVPSEVLEELAASQEQHVLKLKVLSKRLDEILAEVDWIKSALSGSGTGTPEQIALLNDQSEMVIVKGAAGSGKTLALISKGLMQLNDAEKSDDSAIRFEARDKKGIVFAFNKKLAAQVSSVVGRVPVPNSLEVASFDSYVNNLAKKAGIPGTISYRQGLVESNPKYYSIDDAMNFVKRKKAAPSFDYIGIDEAQDLSMDAITFIASMLSNEEGSQLVIAADLNQQLYERDFSWQELGLEMPDARRHTLTKSMRSNDEISQFASRLITDGSLSETDLAKKAQVGSVAVRKESVDDAVKRALKQAIANPFDAHLIILQRAEKENWKKAEELISKSPLSLESLSSKSRAYFSGVEPGKMYLSNPYQIKGLEFDWVSIVDFNDEYSSRIFLNPEALSYTAFSRAKKSLAISYQETPHMILREYFADYLE